MKRLFSTTYNKVLTLIAVTGASFLIITFLSFFLIENQSKTFLAIVSVSFLLTLGVFVFLYKKLINKPANLITEILENNNVDSISELKKLSNKFSHIGDLVIGNNEQKEELQLQKKELQSAKNKAEESERLKESFLTNLSHEIRTPMNAILGFSDLLASQQLSESEKKEYIEVIRRSGKNLVSIIDDLIEMSKIDTNQIKPNYDAFNLDETLNQIKQTVDITIPKDKPLRIFFDKPKHPVVYQLISDETKLRQVIINLVNNAVKYTEEGSVNFGYKIKPDDNALEFYIKDTGIGISEGEFKNIFSRFNRIQNDKTITYYRN